MFERFTDRARRVVVLAQDEARSLNHNYIGTEHLLLGLITEGEGVAAKALESLDINKDAVRAAVIDIIGEGEKPVEGHIPFTPRAKRVFELSLREALQLGHNYIGTEHLLLGLLKEGEGVASQVLIKLGADLSKVRQTVIELLSGYQRNSDDGRESVGVGASSTGSGQTNSAILEQFGRNLTQAARENKLDPVIGRRTEMQRVMQILSRRTKNNPVLVGEPGVGKTAVVEGLAQAIVAGDVPETIKDKQIYSLDMGALVAARATVVISKSASRRSSRKFVLAATSFSSSTRSTPWSVQVPRKAPLTPRKCSSPCLHAVSCRRLAQPPTTSTASTSKRMRLLNVVSSR